MSQTNGKIQYNVLVVDDDDIVREGIVNYLETYHEAPYTLNIEACSDTPPAREKLTQNTYDLVISDINLPTEDGFKFLRQVRQTCPDTKTALITAYKVEDYVKMAKETGVFNIIAKTAPFNFDELSSVVDNLLQPNKSFGLHNYMATGIPIQNITITNSAGIMQSFLTLKAFFENAKVESVDNLLTALMEALTNAVYHVSKLPDGTDKYEKGSVIEQLQPDEYVYVYYAKDNERVGVSIFDQGGHITAQDILYWLDRNISGANILDTHGRGVYLIHTLVDRVVINISPKKQTEIIMLDYFNPEFSTNKPLYINQI